MAEHAEELAKGKGHLSWGPLLDDMKKAVCEALSPKTLFTRAILVLCPAAALCIARLACDFESKQCGGVGIRPRVLSSVVLGIPFAPLVHPTNASLGVDLLGWAVLSFGLTSFGTRFFVFGVLFLALLSGSATWLMGSSAIVHCGTAGVLFGLFGFHLCILPFRRPLKWTDVASFCVFDLLFGGIWWGVHYRNPGYSHCLAYSGLLSGILLGWLYFRVFAGSLEARDALLSERLPLLHSGINAVERATEGAVHAGSDGAVAGLGRAVSAADWALGKRTPALRLGMQAAGDTATRAASSAADSSLALLEEAVLGPVMSGDRAAAAGGGPLPTSGGDAGAGGSGPGPAGGGGAAKGCDDSKGSPAAGRPVFAGPPSSSEC